MLSDEHSCPVLTAALSKATLYLRVCVCVSVCACVRHPHSAPVKRKASPQRSLRQLHPTTWPQTTRLPITRCHISDFWFFTRAYLLSLSSVSSVSSLLAYFFPHLHPPAPSRAAPAVKRRLQRAHIWSSALCNFSHTEHVLRPLAGGIPPTPDGSGVRAALTNNKLERGGGVGGWAGWEGEGKQRQYLGFPLQRALFLDRKIGQVRAERLGLGGLLGGGGGC